MDHGKAHATLGPSAAERWIECPASIHLTASLGRADDSTSVYAEQGTRAHTRAEIEASQYFGKITKRQYNTRLTAWLRVAEKHGDDTEEMEQHARAYVSLLADLMADMGRRASVYLEQRMETGIPGCWGTGDAVLVEPSRIEVVDYKYGQGVVVIAVGNPQLRLYGLGALETFDGVLGDAEQVGTTIHQPRINNSVTREVLTATELREWRETVARPAALETQRVDARFGPSEQACRWCPAAGICAVRARHVLERDFGNPNLLSMEDLADAWRSLPEIRSWVAAVEAETLRQAYSERQTLPGLKVVLSGGKRSITDHEAAIERLVGAGFPEQAVSRLTTRTLGDLEKVVGKTRLPEILGPTLNPGNPKPAVVEESDPREPVDKLVEAQQDFRVEPGADE